MATANKTISSKLILAAGLVISLIVFASTAVNGWRASNRVEAELTAFADGQARFAANEVKRTITEATSAAAALSGSISGYLNTGTATREGLVQLLEAVPGQYETLFSSWLAGLADGESERLFAGGETGLNKDGVLTPYWTKDGSGGLNFSTFPVNKEASWYKVPLETGEMMTTEPYNTADGFVVTSISAPVRYQGKIIAVAGVDITLAELSRQLAEMETIEGGRMMLVDQSGKWVAHPDATLLTKPYNEFSPELLAAALSDGKPQVLLSPDGSFRRLVFPFTSNGMGATWATIFDVPEAAFSAPIREEVLMTILSGLTILAMALGTIYFGSQTIVGRPIGRMLETMTGLAKGQYSEPVPFVTRRDEIGDMARSVETLRLGLVEKVALEREQEALREEAEQARAARAAEQMRLQEEREARRVEEAERERREQAEAAATQAREAAKRAEWAQAQTLVVESLARGLRGLASGQLDVKINSRFGEEYDQLRVDFNETVEHLAELLTAITQSTQNIVGGVQGITAATNDMSRQIETSAATLEETAAALNELTASVQSAAASAGYANSLVHSATEEARATTAIVQDAVQAMGTIQDSSAQISKIINVIDDIAFQTNLLALNAGVEAARAGEAGRGFAVVASEVRALAQRASEAARDINTLISSSGAQVDNGVTLVGRAGDALGLIVESINTVSSHVSEIASSANEQAAGIAEINTAVNQIDRVQQTNAAGVQETASACVALRDQADTLESLVGRFSGAALQSYAA